MSTEKMIGESEERSRAKAIYWAVVLILAGLLLVIDGTGYLPKIGSADAWTYLALGAGLFGSLMNVLYASSTETPNPTSWNWIWSCFWLIIGLGGFFDIEMFWPLALVVVGLVTLTNAIRKS